MKRNGVPKIRTYLHGKTWRIEFYLRLAEHPEKYRHNFAAGETENEANIFASKAVVAIVSKKFDTTRASIEPSASSDRETVNPKHVKFTVLVDEFLKTKKGTKSYRWYTDQTNVLEKFFASHEESGGWVHKLTEEHVRAFKTSRDFQKKEPATVKANLKVLRMLLKFAEGKGYVQANVSEPVKADPCKSRRDMHMDATEFESLVAAAEPWLARVITFATYTGGRKGEYLRLQWCDVDLDNGEVTFRWTKRHDEDRTVSLPARVSRMLKAMKVERPSAKAEDYIFLDRTGTKPLTAGMLRKPFADLVKKLGFHRLVSGRNKKRVRKAFVIHDLRHTAATFMLENDVPLEVVAEQLGHGDIRVTKEYAVVTRKKLARVAEALDRMDAAATAASNRTTVTQQPGFGSSR